MKMNYKKRRHKLIRKDLYNNIVCSGGTTMFKDIEELTPDSMTFKNYHTRKKM